MEKKFIEVALSIEVIQDKIIASVQFPNKFSEKIFLDSWTICLDDNFSNNIFNITDDNNKVISYKGPMVNREVLPEHFIAVDPGEIINTKITLNNGYKLEKGNKYLIQYFAYNPSYGINQHLIGMRSNKVEIVY